MVGSPLAVPDTGSLHPGWSRCAWGAWAPSPLTALAPRGPGQGLCPGGLGRAPPRPSRRAPPGRPSRRPGGRAAGPPPSPIATVFCHRKERLIIFSSKPPPPSPARAVTKSPRTTHSALPVFTVFKAVIKRHGGGGRERVLPSCAASEARRGEKAAPGWRRSSGPGLAPSADALARNGGRPKYLEPRPAGTEPRGLAVMLADALETDFKDPNLSSGHKCSLGGNVHLHVATAFAHGWLSRHLQAHAINQSGCVPVTRGSGFSRGWPGARGLPHL